MCGQLEAVFLLTIGFGGPLCGQLEAVFLTHYWLWWAFVRAVRSSFLTHYWLWGAFVRAVGSSFSYSLLALVGLCAGSWKQFFLLTIGSGEPLCGQLEAVFLTHYWLWGALVRAVRSSFLTHYWLWGAFVRAVGSSFSYSLLALVGLCAGS